MNARDVDLDARRAGDGDEQPRAMLPAPAHHVLHQPAAEQLRRLGHAPVARLEPGLKAMHGLTADDVVHARPRLPRRVRLPAMALACATSVLAWPILS